MKKKHCVTAGQNDHVEDLRSTGTNLIPRKKFFRVAGLGFMALVLYNFGQSKSAVRNHRRQRTARYVFKNYVEQERYYAHKTVVDQFGVIAPWYNGLNGQCDFRIRIAAETLKRFPWADKGEAIEAYPHYIYTSRWTISGEGEIGLVPKLRDWDNGDLGQRATFSLFGFVDYYRYTGDAAALAQMTYMANHVISNCLTPQDHAWPNFPISAPHMGQLYGRANPNGMIQLDISASMALGVLRAYQVVGNARWWVAAKHWGDLFAQHCDCRKGAAPWPRFAVAENIPFKAMAAESRRIAIEDPPQDGTVNLKWRTQQLEDEVWGDNMNVQTGGVVLILNFLDELIRLGYTGEKDGILNARNAGVEYLKSTLLPKWATDATWGYYYWDWPTFTATNIITAEAANYLLNHADEFSNVKSDARNILTIFLNRTSADPSSGTDTYNGAWAYPESSSCCTRSLWYSPLLVAPVMARYGIEMDDPVLHEMAYRQMILHTYDGHENGITEDNIDGGVIVNGSWLNIAHPLPLRCILNAISWLPKELGASRESHIVRSTAVISSVTYGEGVIRYTTFDAPENTVDVLRLSFVPSEVLAGGTLLNRKNDLQQNGYTIEKLSNGDVILSVRHDGQPSVRIIGEDSMSKLAVDSLRFEGEWVSHSGDGLGANESCTPGAAMEAEFYGNQVRLIGAAGENGGIADVYLDGVKQLVHIDAWNSNRREDHVLYFRNGLPNKWHTLKVVVRGECNPHSFGNDIYINHIQYSSDNKPFGYPIGTGPIIPQRMIFGYVGREDYIDTDGKDWRPATEFVTYLGQLEDTVEKAWWTTPETAEISGTSDSELYRYGVWGKDFWINLTVGPAMYTLSLKFAASRRLANIETNTFDIFINDELVYEKLNIYRSAGEILKSFDLKFNEISPKNGIIRVRLIADNDSLNMAFIQALTLIPAER